MSRFLNPARSRMALEQSGPRVIRPLCVLLPNCNHVIASSPARREAGKRRGNLCYWAVLLRPQAISCQPEPWWTREFTENCFEQKSVKTENLPKTARQKMAAGKPWAEIGKNNSELKRQLHLFASLVLSSGSSFWLIRAIRSWQSD